MVACLLCSSPRSIGLLCTTHGVEIASPGITSEQIFSRITAPAASLVDAWGVAHGVADGAKIGRDPRVDLAVLHASVSSEHATFKLVDGAWLLVDHSSRTGTEVGGHRGTDLALTGGTTIRLGDVTFYFWPEALPKISPPRTAGHVPTSPNDVAFSATMTSPRGHLVELRQRADGGVLRIAEAAVELGAMEFGLLRLLVERRRTVGDAELAYVAWHEIADALAFRSVQADSENVRELVHRLRRKLTSLAADDLIESKRGVGYRLASEAG